MGADWDINKYKAAQESDEHWELRKSFMLTHKDKFTEDEIVCLAQVFTNIEFMGCRYPEETMKRVAELAKGVADEYRERKKDCLKRTFVAASDAAGAKVKGLKCVAEEGDLSAEKPKRISDSTSKYGGVKTFEIASAVSSMKKIDAPFADIVLFVDENHKEAVLGELTRITAINKYDLGWDVSHTNGNMVCAKLMLNGQVAAVAAGASRKEAKSFAADMCLEKLKKICYTIVIKSKFSSSSTIYKDQEKASNVAGSSCLSTDNVGCKMMKLMGWSGGGLGNQEQGIQNPVDISIRVDRGGLGVNSNNLHGFRTQVKKYITNWINDNTDQDLVFSNEYNNEERKIMHQLAQQMHLKSKSYGKGDDRFLVISKKVAPWDIVEELLQVGGKSDKYELKHPLSLSVLSSWKLTAA